MKNVFIMLISAFYCFSVAYAAEESTKGIMINNLSVTSADLASAQLTDLSPAAIERGLKDAILLAKPSFDKKTAVLTLSWHSITKQVNGTEFAQALDSPLVTKVKLPLDTTEIQTGQELTIKGDLQKLLDNFDEMIKRSEDKIDVKNEENTTNTTDKNSDYAANNGSSNSDGSGYLSQGGLSETADTGDLSVSTDKIVSSTEACSLFTDFSSMTMAKQERIVKTSSDSGEITEKGACYNIGQVVKIEKDFASDCSIQINGLESYAAGFIYYGFIDGGRLNVSGCKYDSADEKKLTVKLDYSSCSLSTTDINVANATYYPYAVKYSLINGTRYNLTECEPIKEAVTALPTEEESCSIRHDLTALTTYTRHRFNTLDPTEKTVLKTGDCVDFVSYSMQKDLSEDCKITIKNNQFIRGHIMFSIIDGKRYDATGCVYDEIDGEPLTEIKDYKSCSLSDAVIVLDNENYQRAFEKYALIDGVRYELSPCMTEATDTISLPKHTETCDLVHDLNSLTTHRMERIDIYDPSDKNVLKKGDCYSIEEIKIQRDFDAGCAIQLNNTFKTYTRGFKFFSTVDTKKYILSECEYNSSDALAYDNFKDYSKCVVDTGVINLAGGNYQIPFVRYTLIDGTRYELSGCETASDDIRLLPTKTETCDANEDFNHNTYFYMQRIDTYNPSASILLKKGNCEPIGSTEIKRNYDVSYCVNLPDYINHKLNLGYKNYITEDGDDSFIGDCSVDIDNPVPMYENVSTCNATENLSNSKAIINKKWFYDLEDGSAKEVTNCQPSDEIYSIVNTQNTCSPVIMPDSNKVVLQDRKGWVDSSDVWHYVTDCVPTSNEVDIETEICSSPKYEHDFIGGTSYLRTRKFYSFNGSNVYLTSCAREPSISFAQYKETTGCSVANDDSNLRTQLFERTAANLQEGKTIIKGCTASSNYIPYQLLSNGVLAEFSYTICSGSKWPLSLVYSKMFATKIGYPNDWVDSPTSYSTKICSGNGDNQSRDLMDAYIWQSGENWRRPDGSVFLRNSSIHIKWQK
jgi:hypothetical protein